MIARDLMNSHFPFVTVDTDVDQVAKLLAESGLGAVPVVDESLSPIGIVTRSNIERAHAPIDTAELGRMPEFLLRNRKSPRFRGGGRALRDVMTTPAISVSSSAALADIAHTMEKHGLTRAPVVEGDKIIGLLLRNEVMAAMASGAPAQVEDRPVLTIAPSVPKSAAAITAQEFRELVAAHARQAEAERAEQRRLAQELREERMRELASRRLSDGQWREMLHRARQAAVAGMREHMLMRFPSQLCSDGGRAINAPDPNWSETLRGEPADVFQRWRAELQPGGFKIAAQIVDFPDGVPGDAALYLIWGATIE